MIIPFSVTLKFSLWKSALKRASKSFTLEFLKLKMPFFEELYKFRFFEIEKMILPGSIKKILYPLDFENYFCR